MVQAFFPGRLNDRAAAIDGKYTFALVGLLIICPPPPRRIHVYVQLFSLSIMISTGEIYKQVSKGYDIARSIQFRFLFIV